jgi:conjugative relaxase-like TrwC/TraI family protein
VLQVRTIGPGAGAYYLDGSRSAGTWIGPGAAALGLTGTVSETALGAVLSGQDPGTGRFLPHFRPARRRAGWDLVFSAPKSVSLLAAFHPDVAGAHRDALGEALGHLQTRLLGPGWEAVGALFHHHLNAASEPHLHTHVVLVNLARKADGRWAAAGSSDWWTHRQELSAVYQLGLRHHLSRAGWDLDWRLRPDGLADLADVPRAAVRAASTQRASTAWAGWYETRHRASPQPWLERATRAGLADPSWSPPGGTPGSPALPALETPAGRVLAESVTSRLAARRSDFRRTDALVALAATHAKGATAEQANAWVDNYCGQSIRLPSESPTRSARWTTPLAQQAEGRLRDVAAAGRRTGLEVEIWASPPGESSLLSHAALLQERAAAWRDCGLEVRIKARSDMAAHRWEALTGLSAHRSRGRADIVIVDQADRLSAAELLTVLEGTRGRAILVEGGTLPRLSYPNSQAIEELERRLEAIRPAAVSDGGPAVARTIEAWLPAREGLMVGLGVDETQALNSAARRALTADRDGSVWRAGGREFQAGDRVVAMSRMSPAVRRGATGLMVEVSGGRREATVRWDSGGLMSIDPASGSRLGYGYAATPALARWTRGPLVLLGHPDAVPNLRSRVLESVVVGSDRSRDRDLSLGR